MEMVSTIVHQLTRNLSIEEIKAAGFETYFVDHTVGLWPQAASGMPFSSTVFQSKGDPITDLHEDMAAEQKARTTYDNILRLVKDPDIIDPIRFLREREIVHYQRFGEANRVMSSILYACWNIERKFLHFNGLLSDRAVELYCCLQMSKEIKPHQGLSYGRMSALTDNNE